MIFSALLRFLWLSSAMAIAVLLALPGVCLTKQRRSMLKFVWLDQMQRMWLTRPSLQLLEPRLIHVRKLSARAFCLLELLQQNDSHCLGLQHVLADMVGLQTHFMPLWWGAWLQLSVSEGAACPFWTSSTKWSLLRSWTQRNQSWGRWAAQQQRNSFWVQFSCQFWSRTWRLLFMRGSMHQTLRTRWGLSAKQTSMKPWRTLSGLQEISKGLESVWTLGKKLLSEIAITWGSLSQSQRRLGLNSSQQLHLQRNLWRSSMTSLRFVVDRVVFRTRWQSGALQSGPSLIWPILGNTMLLTWGLWSGCSFWLSRGGFVPWCLNLHAPLSQQQHIYHAEATRSQEASTKSRARCGLATG